MILFPLVFPSLFQAGLSSQVIYLLVRPGAYLSGAVPLLALLSRCDITFKLESNKIVKRTRIHLLKMTRHFGAKNIRAALL